MTVAPVLGATLFITYRKLPEEGTSTTTVVIAPTPCYSYSDRYSYAYAVRRTNRRERGVALRLLAIQAGGSRAISMGQTRESRGGVKWEE